MDTNLIDKNVVDMEDALKRIGGNMGLYKKLLDRFLSGDHYDPIAAAINNGDMEEASRLTHSLKGVSANLSLVKVSSISVELEQKIHDNLDCSSCLADLKQAMTETADMIAEIMK